MITNNLDFKVGGILLHVSYPKMGGGGVGGGGTSTARYPLILEGGGDGGTFNLTK